MIGSNGNIAVNDMKFYLRQEYWSLWDYNIFYQMTTNHSFRASITLLTKLLSVKSIYLCLCLWSRPRIPSNVVPQGAVLSLLFFALLVNSAFSVLHYAKLLVLVSSSLLKAKTCRSEIDFRYSLFNSRIFLCEHPFILPS